MSVFLRRETGGQQIVWEDQSQELFIPILPAAATEICILSFGN